MSTVQKINNLEEYIKVAKTFKLKFGLSEASINPWFRGHSERKYCLKPTLYREGNEVIKGCEKEILRDFKLKSRPFINEDNAKSDIEYMMLMQHYGLPTRLLDWSESYLVALFFAVCDYKNEEDASVWVLNPWELNSNISSAGKKSILQPNDEKLGNWLLDKNGKIEGEYPIAIRAVMNSNRIVGQKGIFTLFGEMDDELNLLIVGCNEIIIQGDKKLDLLKELYEAGISYSTIFPEITGLCQEIAFRYSSCLGEDNFKWNNPNNFSKNATF